MFHFGKEKPNCKGNASKEIKTSRVLWFLSYKAVLILVIHYLVALFTVILACKLRGKCYHRSRVYIRCDMKLYVFYSTYTFHVSNTKTSTTFCHLSMYWLMISERFSLKIYKQNVKYSLWREETSKHMIKSVFTMVFNTWIIYLLTRVS